jgi:GNAT superfamily N-acetyltransferase
MVTPATQDMAERISALVHRSFTELCARDWAPDATQVFLEETSPVAMSVALQLPAFAAVENESDEPIGFLLMPRPSLLSLLFVHPAHLRKGVAGHLWEAARSHIEATHPETRTVELNSTPYAFRAYRALGFVPISTEFVRRGCRVTRMACWLPARALGADAL